MATIGIRAQFTKRLSSESQTILRVVAVARVRPPNDMWKLNREVKMSLIRKIVSAVVDTVEEWAKESDERDDLVRRIAEQESNIAKTADLIQRLADDDRIPMTLEDLADNMDKVVSKILGDLPTLKNRLNEMEAVLELRDKDMEGAYERLQALEEFGKEKTFDSRIENLEKWRESSGSKVRVYNGGNEDFIELKTRVSKLEDWSKIGDKPEIDLTDKVEGQISQLIDSRTADLRKRVNSLSKDRSSLKMRVEQLERIVERV
jgi:hypothetical protein